MTPEKKSHVHHRNLQAVAEASQRNFDQAYIQGVMGAHGRSLDRRKVELSDGRIIVDFVRCSYLGLDNHPAIAAGAIEAVREYGSLHWSCARTRLNFSLVAELEDRLSQLFNAHIVSFPTVLAANMGALPILAAGLFTEGQKPIIVFDRLAHATLAYHKPVLAEETDVLTIAHNDVGALEELCRSNPGRQIAYVSDGVYSMGGNAPIQSLAGLQRKYGLFLYIDDAHGISIFGNSGEGFARSELNRPSMGERTIIAASLGKGFGASGGVLMLGSSAQESLIRRYALPYAFSVGPNLASVGAALASADIHDSEELSRLQRNLQKNLQLFDELVKTPQSGQALPIRMVGIGDEQSAIRIAAHLLESGYYVSATFFPTVARGRASLRICPTASHNGEEIQGLAKILLGNYADGVLAADEKNSPL